MSEQQADYVTEALELLGGVSVEIHPEHSALVRDSGEFREVKTPAFIKISTAFKSELPAISSDALKVWIFICLSINRKTERANPGLRTIAAGVKLAVGTVQKAIAELEGKNLLIVDRESRKYNIYQSPEYISANHSDPNVSSHDTDGGAVSNRPETVSKGGQSVSPSVTLNQRNQNKPERTKLPKGSGADWLIMAGVPSEEVAEVVQREAREKEVASLYEKAMGYNPLDWWSDRNLRRLLDFLLTKPEREVTAFAKWSKRPFSTFDPVKARRFPNDVITYWNIAQASGVVEDDGYDL